MQPGVNSLLDTDSELCKEISENEPRKPIEFTKQSAYRMLWRCPNCTDEYRAEINERMLGDDSCPFCKAEGARLFLDFEPEVKTATPLGACH